MAHAEALLGAIADDHSIAVANDHVISGFTGDKFHQLLRYFLCDLQHGHLPETFIESPTGAEENIPEPEKIKQPDKELLLSVQISFVQHL